MLCQSNSGIQRVAGPRLVSAVRGSEELANILWMPQVDIVTPVVPISREPSPCLAVTWQPALRDQECYDWLHSLASVADNSDQRNPARFVFLTD